MLTGDRGTTGIRGDFLTCNTAGGGGGGGAVPTQRFTQPSKQQSPCPGQSVSLTPGLQHTLTFPAHWFLGSGAVFGQP